jgi:2-amino-4-hydroxy-6-hydroxymethyldihydropteridine diphosphokinase
MSLVDAYIGLGSNLDNPEAQLHKAVSSLQQLPDTILVCISSFYQTRPVGPGDQPDYINAVALLSTGLTARQLLEHMQAIENCHGRIRNSHWGPRTLDLDLLLYDSDIINEDDLTVPHPEMHKRGFVLFPLYEIAPEISIPGHGPVTDLLQSINAGDVEKLTES